MSRIVIDKIMGTEGDTFFINLLCEESGHTKSTRVVQGHDFDDALNRSLETQPEAGFVIGTVSRWNRNTRTWHHFKVPTFDACSSLRRR